MEGKMMINNKFKNIFLVGPSRCGKTTTASYLQREYGYTHIIMDAVIETLSEVMPNLEIRHGNLESEEFRDFLKVYSKNLFKYTKNNIIDLEELSPEFAEQLIDKNESTVIYMGYPSITPEEKVAQMRKFDTEFDWTRKLSDEELLDFAKNKIKASKNLQEEATHRGFTFIDTSFNRQNTVIDIFEQLMEKGELTREDDSYKKYYR